ncbi:MAG: VOC family protein [Anaerolineae bacterium]
MFDKFASVTVYVNSQADARAFWVDKVGFKVVSEAKMDDEGHIWLEVSVPGDSASLVLYDKKMMQAQNPAVSTAHPNIIFNSADPKADHDALVAHGVAATEVRTDFWGVWFEFKDQDGNDYMVIKPLM